MKNTIRDFIENGGDFEATALGLYAWQRANNPEYDRFCGAISVNHWSEIPAVPSTLFRDLTSRALRPTRPPLPSTPPAQRPVARG